MQHLFLSDLHLSEKTPDINQSFSLFIDYCLDNNESIENVYILGDLFEFWIGDDYQSPISNDVFNQLKSLSKAGINTFFMHGNRDFLIKDGFKQQTNCTLLPDPHCITLNGQKVILSHGDNLCTDDVKYQEFKTLVRNPQWQQHFLSQPLETRWKMALEARKESMQSQSEENTSQEEVIADVNQQAVEKLLQEQQAMCLIHGHTHRPNTHHFELNNQQAQRIVLAAWYKKGSFLSFDEKENKFKTIYL